MTRLSPMPATCATGLGWTSCRTVRLGGLDPGRGTAILARATIPPDATLPSVEAVLSARELQMRHAQVTPGRQGEFAVGRLVAKTALSRLAGTAIPFTSIDIVPGVFRQPIAHVPGHCGLAVSITHDEAEFAALAFPAGCPLGVDLQHVCPTATAAIVEGLTAAERAVLPPLGSGHQRDELAAALWAAKEALGKALGLGLLVDPDVLAVDGFRPRAGPSMATAAYPRFPPFAATIWTGARAVLAIAHPRTAEPRLV